MTSKHRTTQVLEILLGGNSTEVEAEFEFTFQPGAPEQGPSYASGGQPADPGDVEDVVCVGLKYAGKPVPCPDWLFDWIKENADREAMYEVAVRDDDAFRDEANEMRHEYYREMRAINEDLGLD